MQCTSPRRASQHSHRTSLRGSRGSAAPKATPDHIASTRSMLLAVETAARLLGEAAAAKGAAPLVVLQLEEVLHLRGGYGCGERLRAVG
eukprot:7169116-Prymnesium_polylepis.3